MEKRNIVLFTNIFPFKGGEAFLETEIRYLAENFPTVYVLPLQPSGEVVIALPKNVVLLRQDASISHSLKGILWRNRTIVIFWWFYEFMRSPKRWQYITQFSWNFNRFAGLLNMTENLLRDKRSLLQSSVLYSYWFNEWATVLAMARALGLNSTLVTRAHGYDFDEAQQGRGYHPFRYSEWRSFDKVLQVSNYGVQYFRRMFPRSKSLFLSRLGVEDHGINPISSAAKFHIVSCSNFVPLKRLPLIAAILKKLPVDYHWTHFGDGVERIEVEKEIEILLPPENYTFMGFVNNSDLIKYYSANSVDIFLNVSQLEGVPVSLMEAISFGIPVVGCNTCGVPEIVNERTGLLIPLQFEPDLVAAAMAHFLSATARDREFRRGVKDFWREHFNSAINYPDFVHQHLGQDLIITPAAKG